MIALIRKVGCPAKASYPGQPASVGCVFMRGVTCLTEVIKLLRHNMAANRYERGQLIRRIHLQNADETDSAGDNLSVGSDSRANQRKQFHRNKRTYLKTNLRRGQTENRRKSGHGLPNVLTCYVCHWNTVQLHFGLHLASPGLHVKKSIPLPRVSEVPHVPGVPRFHVNRRLTPWVEQNSLTAQELCFHSHVIKSCTLKPRQICVGA